MRVPKSAGKPARQYAGRKHAEALLRPIVEPLASRWAGHVVQRLLGFWVVWHTYGGDVQVMQTRARLSRAAIYRQMQEFERVFGVRVEQWEPEIAQLLSGRQLVTT